MLLLLVGALILQMFVSLSCRRLLLGSQGELWHSWLNYRWVTEIHIDCLFDELLP